MLQINSKDAVICKVVEFSGMVGESITSVSLWHLDLQSMTITPLQYEEARRMYRNTQGRDTRKTFWQFIKSISPEAEAERDRATLADAIAAVI